MEPFDQLRVWRGLSAIVVIVLLLAWETTRPYLPLFQRNVRQRALHAFRNILFGIMNMTVISLGFATLWVMASNSSATHQFGLLHRFAISPVVHAVAAIVILDLWTYWWHWMNHRIPFLWRFHRMHHSDPQMDVTAANRFHAGEIILSSVLRVPIIALVGIHIWELALYETLMFGVVQFHHANIGLPTCLDRILRIFIPTLDMHKGHHSRLLKETNSNFSSLLSIWDRFFRTFRLRANPKEIVFGLEEWDAEERQKVLGMAKTPFTRPSA